MSERLRADLELMRVQYDNMDTDIKGAIEQIKDINIAIEIIADRLDITNIWGEVDRKMRLKK